MPEKMETTISYDNRLDAYESFFDHAWTTRFMDSVEKSLLHSAGFILCRGWKGIALSSRTSWLLVEVLDTFQKSIWNYKTPRAKQMMKLLVEDVTKDSGISYTKKKQIVERVHQRDE